MVEHTETMANDRFNQSLKFKEEEMEIETTVNKTNGIINMIGRKRIMSEEHKISILCSLENDDPWIFLS